MRAPRIWLIWQAVYGLDGRESRALWSAVQASQWSTVVSWRHELFLFDARIMVDPAHCAETFWYPPRVCSVLEALVAEGRLARAQATRIEEQLLAKVTKEGTWV